uniref:Cyclin-like domain-containing protein n=1 Tax=Leptobrachium leishanense TaxID=445787 RepID=A0A8C5QPE3_9ANUR
GETRAAMIETLVTSEALDLLHQLNSLLDQELKCQPKACSMQIIETAHDNGLRMTAKLRDFEVKDLLSLTQFFGFSAQTFSLSVNVLDRFLSKMKIQPKHLGCVGLTCFYLSVKATEEERNVPLVTDLIRISQYKFTIYDMNVLQNILQANVPNLMFRSIQWIVSGRSARQLKHSYYRIAHLPTIPESAGGNCKSERSDRNEKHKYEKKMQHSTVTHTKPKKL